MKPRAALLAPALLLALAGCGEEVTPVAVEALSQAGRSAFLCLAVDRPEPGKPGVTRPLPIADCSRRSADSTADFDVDAEDGGKAKLPHLYALVTQTSRGEVAVIDLTTSSSAPILDQDTGTPGASFLPVGAQPVDIVATPDGAAAFVAVAEPGREGIFVLPSAQILPDEVLGAPAGQGRPVPSLSSWPACYLGSPPGEMLLVSDPAAQDGDPACNAPGRQRLIVTLPELGGLAIIDAQKLLEDWTPGRFDACPTEPEAFRFFPLEVALPPATSPPAPADRPACVEPAASTPAAHAVGEPRPAGLALAGDRLFVADLDAPVIHVVDLSTPCAPRELPPLLPSSTRDPGRVVTTSRLAVSQASPPEFRRYLYATDAGDGTVMVFDVSDGAPGRAPLAREHPEWNPFQPPDRIRLPAPVRDLAIVEREAPASLSATGVAPEGIRCDPDPGLRTCDSTFASCDLETLYRSSAERDSGAGPLKLRGSFAYLVLTDGRVALADVDDFDAACRGPEIQSRRAGCAEDTPPGDAPLKTSGEASCNVVLPHALRSSTYLLPSGGASQLEPGLQGLPTLFDRSGAIVPLTADSPKMRATLPPGEPGAAPLSLAVGAQREEIDAVDDADVAFDEAGFDERGLVLRSGELHHALAMNLEDPRAHVVDTTWTVTYEGALPDLDRTFVRFDGDALGDADARFCRRGVQSQAMLVAAGAPERDAARLADFVQITSALPAEGNAQWRDAAWLEACGAAGVVEGGEALPAEELGARLFEACDARYGGVLTSRPGLRIVDAYEDHLELTPGDPQVRLAACCFPGEVQLSVRAAGQWVVQSGPTGFLHNVVADPETGQCLSSCDARLARYNGRVVHTPDDVRVTDAGPGEFKPGAFINPMFRFAITGGAPVQDMQFRFATQGAFRPLLVELVDRRENVEIQPQAIRLIPATGELAVTDGSLQGLILLSPTTVTAVRRFQ